MYHRKSTTSTIQPSVCTDPYSQLDFLPSQLYHNAPSDCLSALISGIYFHQAQCVVSSVDVLLCEWERNQKRLWEIESCKIPTSCQFSYLKHCSAWLQAAMVLCILCSIPAHCLQPVYMFNTCVQYIKQRQRKGMSCHTQQRRDLWACVDSWDKLQYQPITGDWRKWKEREERLGRKIR